MDMLEGKRGTPLSDSTAVEDESRRKLAALSVTTAEELLGMIVADPEATAQFLGADDLSAIQADLGREAGPSSMATLADVGETTFALGAAPPVDVEVEDQGSTELFEQRVLPAAEEQPPDLEPGPGANIIACMGPIRNQRNRGTCVAHAVCALAECLLFRRTDVRLDLSEQFLYWVSKDHDGSPAEEGTLIEVAVGRSVSDGICLEEVWPYNPEKVPGNEGQGPPPDAAAGDAANQRLASSIPLPERSPQAIREALDEGNPVALSVPVYKNWHGNPAVNTFGEIPMPLPLSPMVGGHAMCAVGYGTDPQMAGGGYFILRNSWGEGFAPQSRVAPGHALLPYLYFELRGWECFTAAA